MKKILVTYATNSGSTAGVAQAVGEALASENVQVEVLELPAVKSLSGYDGVVVGAPMIMGWHRQALGFLRRQRAALSRLPCAYFLTAVSLTDSGETSVDDTPIFLDPGTARPPAVSGRLTFKERYALPANYVRPLLRAAPGAKPLGVALFGGKLEIYRLPLLQKLFVLLLIQAKPGEHRNFPAIRQWAASLRPALCGETQQD